MLGRLHRTVSVRPIEPLPPRVALAVAGLLLSVGTWIVLVRSDPNLYWRQTDLIVYRDGGAAVWHGTPLYGVPFGPAGLPFTYPPFAGLLFAPWSAAPFAAWQLGIAVVSGIALVLAARASARLAGRTDWPAALVLAAVGLWLEPVAMSLHFGQLNVVLLAAVLVDLASRRRWTGVAIGLAAGIKLTPLIFVPYLWLIGRRRAAWLALASFLGTVAVGAVLLPADARAYWLHLVGTPGDAPNRLVDQSLHGALLRVLHRTSGATLEWALVAALVGAAGLAAAVRAGRRNRPLLGACVVGVTGLLVSPLTWSHHWVWVVPLLALGLDPRWPRAARIGWAAAVVILFGWWPSASVVRPGGLLRLLPHNDNRELTWSWWQLVLGNYYVLAGLLFVAGVAFIEWRPRTAEVTGG